MISRRRSLILQLALGFVLSAKAQTSAPAKPPKTAAQNETTISATSTTRDGSVLQLRGNVQIVTNGIIVQADEATFHEDTGQVELKGNVRLDLNSNKPR